MATVLTTCDIAKHIRSINAKDAMLVLASRRIARRVRWPPRSVDEVKVEDRDRMAKEDSEMMAILSNSKIDEPWDRFQPCLLMFTPGMAAFTITKSIYQAQMRPRERLKMRLTRTGCQD
jgi:hypothetical protein